MTAMGQNFIYYIFLILASIIGVIVIKKVASCIIHLIVTLILIGVLAYAYFMMT